MGISFINADGTFAPINKNVEGAGYKQFSGKTFSASEESIPGKIARNLYKFPAAAVSTIAGLPGDIFNAISNVSNELYGLSGPNKKEDSILTPLEGAPKSLTSAGMKENITSPIGEMLFGAGSQQPQEGFIEGSIDKAAEWLPYSLMPGSGGLAGLGKGFGLSLAQGAVGQGLKSAGVGETGQLVGESLTGFGLPLLGKAAGGATKRATIKTGESLAKTEKSAWDALRKDAPMAMEVEASRISKPLGNIKKDLLKQVGPGERAGTEALFNEVISEIGTGKTSVSNLIDARSKVSKHFKEAGIKGTSGQWKEFKTVLDEHIGKYMGSQHADTLKATQIKKEFFKTDAYRKFVKNAPELADNKAMQAILNYAPLGGAAITLAMKNPVILASTIAAKVGSAAFKNAKLIFGNKQLTDAALKSAGNILKKSAVGTIGMSTQRDFKGEDVSSKKTITFLN